LAEVIKKQLNLETKLIEGAGGVFEVRVNASLVWSKKEMGRFPEHAEVVDKIRTIAAKD